MFTKRVIKFVFALTILIGLILVFLLFLNQKRSDNGPESNFSKASNLMTLYYGKGCPHCEKVQDYIQKNKVDQKINIVRREIYFNQNNANMLEDAAKKCGISEDDVGVPFLVDGNECISGDEPVINYIKENIKGE